MNPDRRNRLILVVLGTLAALAASYSLGITWFGAQIKLESSKLQAIERKLQEQENLEQLASRMGQAAEQRTVLLADLERRMPSGDVYYSLLARLEVLGRAHGIRDLKLVRPSRSAEAVPEELAKLGYVGIRGGLEAVGYYEQIGAFVAAFENELPFMRVTELRLDAVGSRIMVEDGDYYPLGFRMGFDGCATEAAVLQ
jgi:Tfp pilus assembly protein PilO